MSATIQKLPKRDEVNQQDTWDLSVLFSSAADWEKGLEELEALVPDFEKFKGRLGEGPNTLLDCLNLESKMERLADSLGNYAFLRTAEDQTNGDHQRLMGRFQFVVSRAAEAAAFMQPELLGLEQRVLDQYLQSDLLQHFKLKLERIIRYKPHTLSEKEEQLLAMQSEMAQASSQTFRQLHDADMKFGFVENEKGESVELSNATFGQLLLSPDREVRRKSFEQYYEQFESHKRTLSSTLAGSIQKDIYYARARGYDSALEHSLFPDNVPVSVYDNLVQTIRDHLPTVHRYYDLRRRKMGLEKLHQYDTYVPILSDLQENHSWDQAVELVVDSLKPLGTEYCDTLRAGLTTDRWCDRYPNEGKQSGAFSAGAFDSPPYILMNYKPSVLNDVFTLTHEAGHSMHTWFSKKHQEFEYHSYTIFVAEVASTFNEQLLAKHLLDQTDDPKVKAYLINDQIDSIRATIVRQTMFAEFEKRTHQSAESGEPLTVERFSEIYGELLKDYFGPNFVIDSQLNLEFLRIPHFYRAFYVYKYATGLSAAIALSRKVLDGDASDLDAYLNFLKQGCRKDPLDLLADAGVDMRTSQPIETAMKTMADLMDQLEELVPDKN